jgi:hypothetical protein
MIKAVTIALRMIATWSGPSIASSPNRETDPAINTMRVTIGITASAVEGAWMVPGETGRSAITAFSSQLAADQARQDKRPAVKKYVPGPTQSTIGQMIS